VAISPPTDIVMDVLRAADPAQVREARDKLAAARATAAAGTSGFSPVTAEVRAAPRAAAQADPFVKFEAMVLGNFIQAMLPQEAGDAYGGGFAGDMWKSMLAQHMGDAVAARGGIGIANRLLADRYRDGDRTVPLAGASDGATRAESDQQAMLSTALVQELQRKAAAGLAADVAAPATGVTR